MNRAIAYTGPMAARVQKNAYLYRARQRLGHVHKSPIVRVREWVAHVFCNVIW